MSNLNPTPAPHWLFEYAEENGSAYITAMPSVNYTGAIAIEVNRFDLWLPYNKVQELANHLNAFLQHHQPATGGTGSPKQ